MDDLRAEKDERIKVLLVGADSGEDEDFDSSMEELKNLAGACGRVVTGIVTQRVEAVNKAYYVGKGKVEEIRVKAEELGAEEVIFDNDLSPSQVRNLSDILEVSITDRTGLILEIFALRAHTKEAKLQVETARLKYLLPRLAGNYEKLGRQGGTAGSLSNKGSGEKKIELDKRKIEKKIDELEKELEHIAKNRSVKRRRRENSDIPQVALVGYTNAGKSTIMNRFIEYFQSPEEKQVLEKDMLFATLETSVRLMKDGDNKPFYLADTVGFISKLPHDLIKAFRSTLEEVKDADLILHVVDCSDINHKSHMQVTENTLKELGALGIPQIVVFNKADLGNVGKFPRIREGQIYLSAAAGIGIPELAQMIKEKVYSGNIDCSFFVPYQKGDISSWLMEHGTVLRREYTEEGLSLQINLSRAAAAKVREKLSL